MAEKKITTIPATLNKFTSAPINSKKKRRVAGYARVSTDQEEQQTSYQAQVDYYTNYIKSRSDWEFAGLYADDGISATSVKFREGFKRMIADAKAGKIDLIITKSVSRFARNTVDSLTTVRELKEIGVEIYFEKYLHLGFQGRITYHNYVEYSSGREQINLRERHLGTQKTLCRRKSQLCVLVSSRI